MHKELGCGLLALWRPWGTTPQVASDKEAQIFLESAYTSGIRFFDTAPSYGLSEQRLGKFIATLTGPEKNEIIIATKFGEYRDEDGRGYVDFTIEKSMQSITNSMELLGNISLLQVHKTNHNLLESSDLDVILTNAKNLGIESFGLSISDPAICPAALRDDRFEWIQLPYNANSLDFKPTLESSKSHVKKIIINRPFSMGQFEGTVTEAFRFILKEDFEGVILTGTSNPAHLRENLLSFDIVNRE